MAHEDAGNYGAKRSGEKLDEMIAAEIKENAHENKISCARAHSIAVKLKVEPSEVGSAIDLLEIRINKCQLGLFGYGGKKNIPDMPEGVDPEMESAVNSSLVNGRLTCSAAWEIAENLKIPRSSVAGACEKMKIKIIACQLGAFA